MANLYLVSTPIGNLDDISLRALKILKNVPIIACEDTRKTGLLLAHYQIKQAQQLISYFEGNELVRIPQILAKLSSGLEVALVTNAGTPTISDPGFKLARAAIEAGIKVIPLPGPSAVLAALVSSGLPTNKFLFLGFLPKKSGNRKKFLKENLLPNLTTVVYLSPYRITDELQDLKEVIGNQEVVICRELTKVFEETRKDNLENLIAFFQKEKPKGEFSLVFNFSH